MDLAFYREMSKIPLDADKPNKILNPPKIIQGGMGAGVSSWRLARSVSRLGHLGVVSGTGLGLTMTRFLQDGDVGGHIRMALNHFPVQSMATRIWDKYFIQGGRAKDKPYKSVPLQKKDASRVQTELNIVGNFVEVFLARLDHQGQVGINYLEKIQIPHLPSLYGAMLAGVHYVLMGAGIPKSIPGVLDQLSNHKTAQYALSVSGSPSGENDSMSFNPRDFMEGSLPALKKPYFIPIVSSSTLAEMLLRRSNGQVDGFIVEGPTAGGHNAPPRGKLQLTQDGEPIYGNRDQINIERFREFDVPFWLAGGYGSFEGLQEAMAQGAAGIQVGTAFALCEESGMKEEYKIRLLEQVRLGKASVFTDPLASPSGFPFKMAKLEGTLSEETVFRARTKVCDVGFLRQLHREKDGRLVYRCPSEPDRVYISKGGTLEQISGRKCICNGLMGTIGLGQIRKDGSVESAVLTCGEDLENVARFIPPGQSTYRAEDVINVLTNA